jgi:hypothetical protein
VQAASAIVSEIGQASKEAEEYAKSYSPLKPPAPPRPRPAGDKYFPYGLEETGSEDSICVTEKTWWGRDVATAWVLTRDRKFVQHQQSRRGEIGLELLYNTVYPPDRRSLTPNRAWELLREQIVDDRIRIVGEPFERVDRGDGNAAIERSPDRTISGVEFGSLDLEFLDGQEVWVHPRGSNWNNSRGYLNVRFLASDVMAANRAADDDASHHVELDPALISDLGPPIRPEGAGYMKYSEAAYWIASQDGKLKISEIEDSGWEIAYRALNDHIATGDVHIIGRRHGEGPPTEIEGYRFSGILIEYPFSNLPFIRGGEPYVLCRLHQDKEHWHQHYNDQLMADHRLPPEFTHLEVRKSDIARLWPFALMAQSACEPASDSSLVDDAGGNQEDGPGAKMPGRMRVSVRPLHKKSGEPTIVTAIWDTIENHDVWKTDGIPEHWSSLQAALEISKHFRRLVSQNKLGTEYQSLKRNSEGKYEFEETTVRRALGFR